MTCKNKHDFLKMFSKWRKLRIFFYPIWKKNYYMVEKQLKNQKKRNKNQKWDKYILEI